MNNGDLNNLPTAYSSVIKAKENYKILLNSNKYISEDSKGKLISKYIMPAETLADRISNEANTFYHTNNAIEYIANFEYSNATFELNQFSNAISKGQSDRAKKGSADLPDKLKIALNNKVVSLKNVLAGKDVSLNYIYWRYNSLDVTNYSILKYKEDHSGNLPYIKLHLGKKTNGVKYLSGYKTVKVTVNVTKTGAYNLSRLKNNEREIYFNVGYYSDYNQSITENYDTNWSYELSATEKKTLLTYTFPKNYTYDDGLLILFPEVEGITFENLVFNK